MESPVPITETSPHPPATSYGSTIITIKVGKSKQEFHVHKDVLCHHSQYFAGALSGHFQESHEEVIELGEDIATVFQAVVHWMYTCALPAAHPDIDCLWEKYTEEYTSAKGDSHGKKYVRAQYLEMFMVQIWIFADARIIPQLQDAVVDTLTKIYTGMKHPMWSTAIDMIYEKTLQGCPLRALARDLIIHSTSGVVKMSTQLTENPSMFPTDFALDVLSGYAKRQSKNPSLGPDWNFTASDYYVKKLSDTNGGSKKGKADELSEASISSSTLE